MARLIDQIDEIRKKDPLNQEIPLSDPHEWENLIREGHSQNVEHVYRNLSFKQTGNCKVISRGDIISSRSNPEECIIKAMIWAFPKNVEKSPVRVVLSRMVDILRILNNKIGKDLNDIDYLCTYTELYKLPGIKDATISIILYALGISFNGRKTVAITNHTKNASTKFADLNNFINWSFIPQLIVLNIEANKLEVDPEQIEYYLYRVSTEKLNLN